MRRTWILLFAPLLILFILGTFRHHDRPHGPETTEEKLVFETSDNEIIAEGTSRHIVASLQKHYNVVSVAIELIDNFDELMEIPDRSVSVEEAQDIVKKQREMVKAHYKAVNERMANVLELGFLEADVEVSYYTNFIFLYYESDKFYDFHLEECRRIAENPDVGKVYIRGNNTNESKREVNAAKGKIYVNPYVQQHPGCNGTGISVGILDAGIIDENHPEFTYTDYLIRDEFWYWETVDIHATTVALTIGGNSGIAPGARLLSVERFLSWVSPTEWLLDNGVNIINISISSGTPGKYTSDAAYMDKVVRNSDVLIVGSAGNRGNPSEGGDYKVTSPKTGFNVITVGNTNYLGILQWASSYKTDFSISKPNISAPAETMHFPGITQSFGGTSYASAEVSGVAALLMQTNPLFVIRPHFLGALLPASATPNYFYSDKDASGYEKTIGAGWVNLEVAITHHEKAFCFYNSSNIPGNTVKFHKVYLNGGKRIKIAFYSLVNSDGTTSIKTTDYDLYLRDITGFYLKKSESRCNNSELIDIVLPPEASGYYYIEVVQFGQKKTDLRDYCSYAYVEMDPDLSSISYIPEY